GTAADVMKLALVRVDAALRESAVRPILTVHDELLFEGPADEIDGVRALIRHEMCAFWEHDPPLGVDIGVGPTWMEAK
ncbi:MAG TPA: DNA polymerase, partial [Solirubrobacteraceae bacterium]|nr:DNA polymerase [Solirubrobacteraceae bacterium]